MIVSAVQAVGLYSRIQSSTIEMVSQKQPLGFSTTVSEEVCVIELPPLLTVVEAVAFKDKFQQFMQTESLPPKIALNFGQTTFIDSSGIGALVLCLKATQSKKLELVLQNLRSEVLSTLALASLDQLFQIEHDALATAPTPTKPTAPLPTHPSVTSVAKRRIDIVGAIVGLGITALLFVPIAIAIKLDSPGPIFFSQTRCGLMGRRFQLWKFRSMVTNAEALKAQVKNQNQGAFFKNDNDPRITRVGRFLRKTSLDELPQFWNVLKGEMSLTGTRPPLPDEVDRYDIPNWQRLDVKPGMTGEWQVNGRSSVRSFEDVIALDLRYQERWSLRYDLQLIAKTVLVLFRKNNAF